jgi:hypothetical protein
VKTLVENDCKISERQVLDSETKGSKKPTKVKITYDRCRTIANEEDDEFREESTDKHKDWVKKFDHDSTALERVFRSIPRYKHGKRD